MDQPHSAYGMQTVAARRRPDPVPTECPRCPSRWVDRIRAMRQYSKDDWYRCDHCGHLFTVSLGAEPS
ncbi:MAG: hypothetical protein ABUS56_08460 [Acidobacteriota bacterium]